MHELEIRLVSPSVGAALNGGIIVGGTVSLVDGNGRLLAKGQLRELTVHNNAPATPFGLGWSDDPASMEPPEPPDVPMRRSDTPVIGYRGWKLDLRDAMRLRSVVSETVWDGPVLRADGKPAPYDPHRTEWRYRDDHCHGIYAYTDAADAIRRTMNANGWDVCGRIRAAGRVVMHTHGFRAEYAVIERLVLHPEVALEGDAAFQRQALADRYHCDVSFDVTELLEE